MRPRSMILYERVYGVKILFAAALALWVQTHLSLLPAGVLARLSPGQIAAGTMVSLLVDVALLYWVARRAMRIARDITLLLFLCATLITVYGLAVGTPLTDPRHILSLILFAIRAGAMALLLSPESRRWFREMNAPAEPTLS